MTTPYGKIQRVFHSSFQDKKEIIPELEEQFFINAIGDFSLDLYDLEYETIINTDGEVGFEIKQDLSQAEVNLLGKLMYKHYLHRERDRIMKLNNIVGRDIRLTGMSDTKQVINKMYDNTINEIDVIMTKLKNNTYYE